MSKTTLIILGSLLLLLGQVFAWFLNNSQFAWEWWKDKPFFTAALWAFPVSLAFWWGSKWSYEGLGTAWSSRLLAFGLSYISFPILTWINNFGQNLFSSLISEIFLTSLKLSSVCI